MTKTAKRSAEEIAAMEAEVREFQDNARKEADRAEAARTKQLVDFVNSAQYRDFISTADAIRASLIGEPLVTHLAGALVSFNALDMNVRAAVARYEAAAE